jgi:hypothetical protein
MKGMLQFMLYTNYSIHHLTRCTKKKRPSMLPKPTFSPDHTPKVTPMKMRKNTFR